MNKFIKKRANEVNIPEKKFHEQSLTEKKKMVALELINKGVQHPEIVLAQALLESANFKSYIFRTNNNMFGMRMPNKRETSAISEFKGYAVYDDWEASIEDYAMYQKSILKGKNITKDEYLDFLGRRYAESPDYVKVVKKIAFKVEKENIIP